MGKKRQFGSLIKFTSVKRFNESDFIKVDTLSKWEDSKIKRMTELVTSKCKISEFILLIENGN